MHNRFVWCPGDEVNILCTLSLVCGWNFGRCFSVNFAIFLRTSFLKEHFLWLLLTCHKMCPMTCPYIWDQYEERRWAYTKWSKVSMRTFHFLKNHSRRLASIKKSYYNPRQHIWNKIENSLKWNWTRKFWYLLLRVFFDCYF